jgi:hypothetical protein
MSFDKLKSFSDVADTVTVWELYEDCISYRQAHLAMYLANKKAISWSPFFMSLSKLDR